jgi:DNA-binding GntR family transcriptional regulator
MDKAPPSGPRQRALQLYAELRDRICLLDYAPGAIIKERELAAEFGVSRTPLRRVLQWLESDGLILSRQGYGTVVTEIDLQDIKDIYFLRIRLAEMTGASGPDQPGAEVLRNLVKLADLCRNALDRPDYRTFAEINIGLHKQFQSVIRNRPLREISDKLFYQTARMWSQLLVAQDWNAEIEDMLQEIVAIERYFRRGDVEAAGYERRNRIAMVARRLDSLI